MHSVSEGSVTYGEKQRTGLTRKRGYTGQTGKTGQKGQTVQLIQTGQTGQHSQFLRCF